MMHSRFGFRATMVLAAIFASGCGGEKFVTVTGMATRHGKPVPNLAIIFSPEKGLRSFALTDENGKFKMVHSTGRDGVLVGTHKVWVQLKTAGSREDKDLQKSLAKQQSDPEIAQILRKYGNVETTPITIEAKDNQEINLTLD
jgi:hypothetical protein